MAFESRLMAVPFSVITTLVLTTLDRPRLPSRWQACRAYVATDNRRTQVFSSLLHLIGF